MKATELTTEERIELAGGRGMWHTSDLSGKLTAIHLSDGPHGLRAQSDSAKSNNDSITATCFPTASATACSFDRELLGLMASAIAKEAKTAGVSVLLGPGVNMKRNPLCGRNFEYFSEDPFLAGELATSYVCGVQENGVGTSLKHFAANNQETHRMTSNSVVDERTLREIYLRAFEIVVKNAKPATIMASYNLLNGKPACENRELLTDILRTEWGYEGLVMSDWGACVDAGACIEAGMDLEMPDSHGNHEGGIYQALCGAKLTEEGLKRAAQNVITLTESYPPTGNGLSEIPEQLLDRHHELAIQVSEESAVLLKNNGLLPLKNPSKVLLVGELAEHMRIQGGGSSHIHTRPLVNILAAFAKSGIETVYVKGYDSTSMRDGKLSRKDKQYQKEALSAIRKAKEEGIPILVFGGLTDVAEGEGYDRTTLKLPYNQRMLYNEMKELASDVIFVSFGGSPYDTKDIDFAGAVLNMYLGGEGVAEACVNLLLGKKNPSGRLAETWPGNIEDVPSYVNFGTNNETIDDVLYCEGPFIGYRYFDTYRVPVNYPFGYGLSYTTFSYKNMTVTQEGERLSVEADITNDGDLPGKETVLVFVKNPEGDFLRCQRELRGFCKVELKPGETKHVRLLTDDHTFMVYDTEKESFVTAAGTYIVEISKSVGDVILSLPVETDGEELHGRKPSKIPMSKEEFRKLYGREIPDFTHVKPGNFTAGNSLSQLLPYSKRARYLLKFGKLMTPLLTGKPLSDPESRMMFEGISEGNIDSVCNQSGGIVSSSFIRKMINEANNKK